MQEYSYPAERIKILIHIYFTDILTHAHFNICSSSHLCVDWRLLRLQPCALKVFDLVLLVDLVVSLASGTAGHVIPHAVVSPLFLNSGVVGRCGGSQGRH